MAKWLIQIVALNVCTQYYRDFKQIYEGDSLINITGDFRLGDITHNIANIAKAKTISDFKTSIGLEEVFVNRQKRRNVITQVVRSL